MARLVSHEGRRRAAKVRNLPPNRAQLSGAEVRRLPPQARGAARALRAFRHELPGLATPQEVLDAACRLLVRVAGYRMAWIGLARNDPRHSVRPVSQAGIADGYLEHLDVTWADEQRGHGPTGTAIRTRLPIVARNILTDRAFEPWRLEALRRGFASSAAIPIVAQHGKPLGAINVYAEEPDAFARQELEVLRQLAAQIVTALRGVEPPEAR